MQTQIDSGKQPQSPNSKAPHGRDIVESSELHPIFQLQQQAGNQAIQALLRNGFIQAKLTISSPDDPAEIEADQVAHSVMHSGPSASHCSCGGGEECQQKQCGPEIQRSATSPSTPAHVPEIVGSVLRSPGRPLDSSTRAFFEPRFGRDLSHVRVHADSAAAESAHSIQAHAYTVGNHVVFASRQFSPETEQGQTLLAHELTHVAQQEKSQTSGATIQRAAWGKCPEGTRVPALNPFLYNGAEYYAQFQYRAAFGGHCLLTNRMLAEGTYPENCSDDENVLVDQVIRDFHHGKTVRRRPVLPPDDVTQQPDPNTTRRGVDFFPASQEPDIVDVTEREVYDVTTVEQRYAKLQKIDNEYLPILVEITDRHWEAGTNLPPFSPLTFPLLGNKVCYGATDFATWPGVIQYEIVSESEKPEEKEKKENESKDNETKSDESLLDKLEKIGEEAAKLLAEDALLDVAVDLALTLGALVASPLVALAALVLGVVYFWDELKALGNKIASVARWVFGKISWVLGKIALLGEKLGELGAWLGDKIAFLAKKLAEGIEWAADKVVSGVKWTGRKIASGAKALWDWFFDDDPEPQAPDLDLPVTEDRTHCATVAHEDTIVKIGADLLFATAEYKLKAEADAPLQDAADKIRPLLSGREDRVTIAGYTDNVGGIEYNQHLSEQRAQSVADWFDQHHIIPKTIIHAEGYGKTQALANDPDGRAKDRHVEIWVTKHGSTETACW
jgi:outer membrane protein OmpA-like peptidoglycan-associated protein